MVFKARIIPGLFLLLASSSLAYADTVYLKNGRKIEGLVKSDGAKELELEVGANSSVTFLKSEVNKVIKSSAAGSSALRQRWEKRKLAADEKMARLQIMEEKKPSAASFSHDPQGILVRVLLNDKVSTIMVLDTGSSLVLLTKDTAQKLGIDLSGAQPDLKAQVADGRSINAKRLAIRSMEVHGVTAKNVEAAVLLDDPKDLRFGGGLLGMSFLKRFNFKVDQKEKKLTLEQI